jgi:hypothetical protein
MIAWREIPRWSLRAWPVLALLPVFAVHALSLDRFATSTQLVNKLAGMSLQVVGGLIILYSVNDNLGLFRKQSLWGAVVAWVRSFPFARKSVTLSARGSASGSFGGAASISTRKGATTLDERVEHLEQDLRALKLELQAGLNGLQSRIDSTRSELVSRIDETAGKVSELKQKVEAAAVGSFKTQAFGVLLAIYGAVTSVFA